MISVPLPKPVIFTIRPLLKVQEEQFTFQVIFCANLCPVPSVIKDYLVESVYSSHKNKAKVEQNRITYTLYDEMGNEAMVHAEISPVRSSEIDEREGPRILIGRYCLLDNRTQMQVIDYNEAKQTFSLRTVKGESIEKRDISISRIKRIERYGVSIYDLDRLPQQIERSKFEFTCTIVTKNS